MGRGIPVGLFVLALATSSLVSESPGAEPSAGSPSTAASISFEPGVFHAGERVVARLVLGAEAPGLAAFSFGPASGLRFSDIPPELEIDSVSLARFGSGWRYSVTFVVWAPGSGSVPSLSIEGRDFPTFDFVAAPITGPLDRLPGPRRPQADPPGMAVYLYAAVGLFVVLILAALAFVFWILPGALALLDAWRLRAAWRDLSKTLDWLGENGNEGEGRVWFALLARALRSFLARRLFPGADALTPPEIARLSPDILPPGGFGESLANLLELSDEVRFAGRIEAAGDRIEALKRARRIADAVEDFGAADAGVDALPVSGSVAGDLRGRDGSDVRP